MRSLCTPRDLPPTVQSCVLPKDCQVTDWSEWAACSKACVDPASPVGRRARSRRVLQFPVGEGAECAALEESEACEPQGEGVPPCST
ncbi:Thrombospondin type-1 domain-containing protein 7A [Liparis tanakae]|uniref:Thrombospondin type-1 domain-containing protein 7A n=1 Tax=Liparis tanakae TaxID=230148 RepID=A0A4Z2GIH0_9TELE|nr:Thrombospondin type-1 domain-containing protein 7A [Liparis tanakae]